MPLSPILGVCFYLFGPGPSRRHSLTGLCHSFTDGTEAGKGKDVFVSGWLFRQRMQSRAEHAGSNMLGAGTL